jgi:hypothetical protein
VFKWILCSFAIAAMFWTGIITAQEKTTFTADRHKERNVKCLACHGEAEPKTAASAKGCMTCHKSLEAVAERTKDYPRNPHMNHLTESSDIECTQCHKGHKEDTPVCLNCHSGMKFER